MNMDTITFDEFIKADIRVGTIATAEPIPRSKMLKLTVSFGAELGTRTVLAGIAEAYNAEALPGLQIVAVVNLPPREMKGITSEAMLLAGRSTTGQLILVSPNGIAEGERIG
jgi:methionine--tRNA ligase beta chain